MIKYSSFESYLRRERMFKTITAALLLGFLTIAGAQSFSSFAVAAENAPKQALQPLKHSDVCMVQNRYGTMKMILVEVDGKMYYGCCAGCIGKLKLNPAVRFAKDPVSGIDIDKSKAFIVGNIDGTVTYFESRETAEKFFAKRKSL